MISLCTLLVDGYLKELTPLIINNRIKGNKVTQKKIKDSLFLNPMSGMNIDISKIILYTFIDNKIISTKTLTN